MNIYIPHHWLLEHLETKATPDQIKEYLSLCGPSVERIEDKLGDQVYDIEVTTNRVDMMSARGIAREAATILPEFGIPASVKPVTPSQYLDSQLTTHNSPALDINIQNDPNLCHRILAIKMSNVTVADSPEWLQTRLQQVGQRPLNNIIDITNYVMWELGHPIHAFDYDKLTQKKIIVREAREGEQFTTLDNKTFTCIGGEVIFDDGTGTIIDLPGIMGTKNTVVDNQTKNVLLWIEAVDAKKIRFASMTHAIRSQAAILNEKHVDTELGLEAINRATQLYLELTSGQIGSQLTDIYPNTPDIKPVILEQSQLNTYMGLPIEPARVQRILEALGCQVQPSPINHQPSYTITPPSYRARDLCIYQDLIEEIARIYGYHNIPSQVMDTQIPANPVDENFNLESQIKTWLAGWGCQEIYTYSMVSQKTAERSGYPLADHLKIKNPLTDDMVYLRRSLIPSLVEVIDANQQRPITVFEMQNVYHPNSNSPTGLPQEDLRLTLVTTQDYRHLKGLLDALIDKLYLNDSYSIDTDQTKQLLEPKLIPKATIYAGDERIGSIGKIDLLDAYALNLSMTILSKVARTNPAYIPTKSTPPIIEDLTFAFPKETYIGPVIQSIKEINKLIESVSLKDSYSPSPTTHNPQPTINHTFTITYRDASQNLSAEAVTPIRSNICTQLTDTYHAKLIGTIQ